MKKIIMVAGLLALAACNKTPEPTTEDAVQTLTPQEEASLSSDVPMADTMPDNASETSNATEEDLDNSSAEMVAQQEADEAENNPISIVNTGNTNRNYVLRDAATGCEFIQFDDTGTDGTSLPIVARPNGRGGQRGCGTGTDFKEKK